MAGWDDLTNEEIDDYIEIDSVLDEYSGVRYTKKKEDVNIWLILLVSIAVFLLVFFLFKNKK